MRMRADAEAINECLDLMIIGVRARMSDRSRADMVEAVTRATEDNYEQWMLCQIFAETLMRLVENPAWRPARPGDTPGELTPELEGHTP